MLDKASRMPCFQNQLLERGSVLGNLEAPFSIRIGRSSCPTSFCTAILASGSAFAGASVPIPRTARRGSANTTIGAWNVVRHRLLPCGSAMLIRTPAVATRKDAEALFGPGAH